MEDQRSLVDVKGKENRTAKKIVLAMCSSYMDVEGFQNNLVQILTIQR